jgi:hypothetical protein
LKPSVIESPNATTTAGLSARVLSTAVMPKYGLRKLVVMAAGMSAAAVWLPEPR